MNEEQFDKLRHNYSVNLWQSIEWSNFQKDLGKDVYIFGDDEAIAVGVVQDLPFGQKYLEIPRGPLGETCKSFWKEVKEIAKQNNCIFTRISPVTRMLEVPTFRMKAPHQVQPENTLVLNLTLSEEELLKQMKPKGRYNIRIAQRHNVTVFESDKVSLFYDLLEDTSSRDRFSSHPLSYYSKMLESLGENAKLYLASIKDAREGEVVIAGGIFVFMDGVCTYYYGASANSYRNVMAPALVQWHAICEARKKNCKLYDFLGIAPENAKIHPLNGVTKFKLLFGGKRLKYPPAIDIIYKPAHYLLYWIYKIVRKLW